MDWPKMGLCGQVLKYKESTSSTNNDLIQLARMNFPEGSAIFAHYQTSGRGRMGRTWLAPPESSLLLSVLFRPNFLEVNNSSHIGMICALAMREAVFYRTGIELLVKWPNDLLALVDGDYKKICGILSDACFSQGKIVWMVTGLGLNVNLNPKDDFNSKGEIMSDFSSGNNLLPSETATSISELLGYPTQELRASLLTSFLENLQEQYDRLKTGESPVEAVTCYLAGMEKTVKLTNPFNGETHVGKLVGLTKEGGVILENLAGKADIFLSGDISLSI